MAVLIDDMKKMSKDELLEVHVVENCSYTYGNTLLNDAIRSGNEREVQRLLDLGIDVNFAIYEPYIRSDEIIYSSPIFNCALLEAIKTKSESMVKLLISRGANVSLSRRDDASRPVLAQAIYQGSEPILDIILEADPNIVRDSIRLNPLEVTSAIPKWYTKITDYTATIKILDKLISNGLNIDHQWTTQWRDGRRNIIQPYSLLNYALDHKQGAIVDYLLSKGASIEANRPVVSALTHAIEIELANVQKLLTHGADINAVDPVSRKTPLETFVSSRFTRGLQNSSRDDKELIAIFDLLMAKDVAVYRQPDESQSAISALESAIKNKFPIELINQLVEKQLNQIKDPKINYPLMVKVFEQMINFESLGDSEEKKVLRINLASTILRQDNFSIDRKTLTESLRTFSYQNPDLAKLTARHIIQKVELENAQAIPNSFNNDKSAALAMVLASLDLKLSPPADYTDKAVAKILESELVTMHNNQFEEKAQLSALSSKLPVDVLGFIQSHLKPSNTLSVQENKKLDQIHAVGLEQQMNKLVDFARHNTKPIPPATPTKPRAESMSSALKGDASKTTYDVAAAPKPSENKQTLSVQNAVSQDKPTAPTVPSRATKPVIKPQVTPPPISPRPRSPSSTESQLNTGTAAPPPLVSRANKPVTHWQFDKAKNPMQASKPPQKLSHSNLEKKPKSERFNPDLWQAEQFNKSRRKSLADITPKPVAPPPPPRPKQS